MTMVAQERHVHCENHFHTILPWCVLMDSVEFNIRDERLSDCFGIQLTFILPMCLKFVAYRNAYIL